MLYSCHGMICITWKFLRVLGKQTSVSDALRVVGLLARWGLLSYNDFILLGGRAVDYLSRGIRNITCDIITSTRQSYWWMSMSGHSHDPSAGGLNRWLVAHDPNIVDIALNQESLVLQVTLRLSLYLHQGDWNCLLMAQPDITLAISRTGSGRWLFGGGFLLSFFWVRAGGGFIISYIFSIFFLGVSPSPFSKQK